MCRYSKVIFRILILGLFPMITFAQNQKFVIKSQMIPIDGSRKGILANDVRDVVGRCVLWKTQSIFQNVYKVSASEMNLYTEFKDITILEKNENKVASFVYAISKCSLYEDDPPIYDGGLKREYKVLEMAGIETDDGYKTFLDFNLKQGESYDKFDVNLLADIVLPMVKFASITQSPGEFDEWGNQGPAGPEVLHDLFVEAPKDLNEEVTFYNRNSLRPVPLTLNMQDVVTCMKDGLEELVKK